MEHVIYIQMCGNIPLFNTILILLSTPPPSTELSKGVLNRLSNCVYICSNIIPSYLKMKLIETSFKNGHVWQDQSTLKMGECAN